jgi:hypothetical protein
LLLAAGVYLLYPACRYYVDPDATSYLTISQRYADGDYARAINGYWSPWSCWLTVLLIKSGLAVIPASIIINTLGGMGLLIITQSYFELFKLRHRLQYMLQVALAGFLCYAVFKQNFADLWECFFLLCSLRIMLLDGYKSNAGLWLLNGAIGTLAYFAKAYAFPFFILNTLCCGFYLSAAWARENRAKWLTMSAVAILTMVICSSPWLYLLHDKYDRWTTSTAGSLNASWYLVGHPYWKDGIAALLPPVYSNSPYYWEDPYVINGITPHFWSSPKLFLLQIAKAGYNSLKFILASAEISVFLIVLYVIGLLDFSAQNTVKRFDDKTRIVLLSFLLFPLGFLIINYEARYIWYMLPLSMLLGGLVLQKVTVNTSVRSLLIIVFAASYLLWPVWDMRNIYGRGKEEYIVSQQLNSMGIKGSFTTLMPHGHKTQDIVRLAYFSGNGFYMAPRSATTKEELLSDMRRYRVKYYFKYESDKLPGDIFTDDLGKPFPELTGGRIKGLRVFEVNP